MSRIEKLNKTNVSNIINTKITDVCFEKDGVSQKLILTNEQGFKLHCSAILFGYFVQSVFELEYP